MEHIAQQFIDTFGDHLERNDKKGIVNDPDALSFLEKMYRFLEKYEVEVAQYCEERDSSAFAEQMKKARFDAESELHQIFAKDVATQSVAILLMSSFGARTHLKGTKSDIDIGLCVKTNAFDKDMFDGILISNGFAFKKELFGYYVYTKTSQGIEIEVKLREYEKSIQVIKLHDCLDKLPTKIQDKLAFAKALSFTNTRMYDGLKWEIYSAYYSLI